MKIGIVADIHSNLRAFEAVLKDFKRRNIDKIISLGDMIGYYHNPLEIIELLMSLKAECILGNHEAYLLGYIKCPAEKRRLCFLDLVKEKINSRQLNWLKRLPDSLEISINSKKLAFFHGSPWNHLNGYIYPDFNDFKRFLGFPWSFIFLGHTHYKMLKKLGDVYIVNPGSCGQPRDKKTKASAAIFNLNNNEIEFVNQPYDTVKTINEAKIAGVSRAAILKLETIR